MKEFTYRDRHLAISAYADITDNFFRRHDLLLQEAIDGFALEEDRRRDAPWVKGEDPIFTYEISAADGLNLNVVELEPGEEVLWAVHANHKAHQPKPSPFVRRPAWPPASTLTIEFAGTAAVPVLTRAYPGEYRPPLPWMNSAGDAYGGRPACQAYWNGHAYIYTPKLVRSARCQAPEWFRR